MGYLNIMDRLWEHSDAVKNQVNDYFALVLQGSQNYGISDEESDIDSKMLTIPNFDTIVFNKKPQNHVHVMENNEHCDLKDIREYFRILRKSNINFMEVLFSDYYIVGSNYVDEWNYLRNNNELIAHLNPYRAVRCMYGMAMEKRHALCHEYPSRMPWIEAYGFDPKQLSHLARIAYFVNAYINDAPYKDCIYPESKGFREFLLNVKRNNFGFEKMHAESLADCYINGIKKLVDDFCEGRKDEEDKIASDILDEVLYSVMKKAIKAEL